MQSELENARRAYESRLANLHQRKDELEAGLRQVETEIQEAAQGTTPPPPGSLPAPQPGPATSPAQPATSLSLPQLLIGILRESGRPMTTKDLAEELVRRKFSTTSTNLPKMVGSRVYDLMEKGVVARAKGQEGVVLVQSAAPATTGGTKPDTNGQVAGKDTQASVAGQPQPKSLRDLMTHLLARSDRPLKAKDLAEMVLATGYRTKSNNFITVVWSALSQMENVVNVSGKGYHLKKGAAKSK